MILEKIFTGNNMFTKEILTKYMNEGLITCRRHPEFPYSIFNYTPKVQFKRLWDEVTINCRGLILDDDMNIIAKPFPKFFNYEEIDGIRTIEGQDIPEDESYTIYDKADGSLGISYRGPNGRYYIASRGSFDSEQAQEGTRMLHERWAEYKEYFDYGVTYLFEIVYPENRIVVDYGDFNDLVFLGAIDYLQNRDMTNVYHEYWPFSKVVRFPNKSPYSFRDIRDVIKGKNREGFVVLFENGFRIKLKYEEYVKLHRVISTYNNDKYIWECLKDGVDIEDMIKDVPDEYYIEIDEKIKDFKTKYAFVRDYCISKHEDLAAIGLWEEPKMLIRKNQALWIKDNVEKQYHSILFKMLDGKDYSELVWKIIKPKD